ncbi:hypothetical protein X741_27605 [Mesorhizobium sp. LNHC229A00]|nr:hypothetical protein X741_27605 [Mesorhizobium sp. LNHC229A00]
MRWAGAYEALVEKGHQPKHVVGTSIGAITGAIIAGNRPEDRLNRLHAFWAKAEQTTVGSQAGVWVNRRGSAWKSHSRHCRLS